MGNIFSKKFVLPPPDSFLGEEVLPIADLATWNIHHEINLLKSLTLLDIIFLYIEDILKYILRMG